MISALLSDAPRLFSLCKARGESYQTAQGVFNLVVRGVLLGEIIIVHYDL